MNDEVRGSARFTSESKPLSALILDHKGDEAKLLLKFAGLEFEFHMCLP